MQSMCSEQRPQSQCEDKKKKRHCKRRKHHQKHEESDSEEEESDSQECSEEDESEAECDPLTEEKYSLADIVKIVKKLKAGDEASASKIVAAKLKGEDCDDDDSSH